MCNTCNESKECSATLYLREGTYFILAQYGSRYDMQLFALKRGHHQIGTICDDCIEKLINAGTATMIEDGVW